MSNIKNIYNEQIILLQVQITFITAKAVTINDRLFAISAIFTKRSSLSSSLMQ